MTDINQTTRCFGDRQPLSFTPFSRLPRGDVIAPFSLPHSPTTRYNNIRLLSVPRASRKLITLNGNCFFFP